MSAQKSSFNCWEATCKLNLKSGGLCERNQQRLGKDLDVLFIARLTLSVLILKGCRGKIIQFKHTLGNIQTHIHTKLRA